MPPEEKLVRSILKKAVLPLVGALWLTLVAAAWAEASTESPADRAPAAAAKDSVEEADEYSFSWLDPDKQIYVLQNRKYTKTGRPMISVLGGVGLSSAYRNTLSVSPRLAFYFLESLGIEGFFSMTRNSASNTFKELEIVSASLAIPAVREFRSQFGGLIHWVPWYAKINFFNQILYFDWYLSGGAGRINAEVDTNTQAGGASKFVSQGLTSFYLGTGHQYHISRHISLRADFTGAFYQAPLLGVGGDDTWFSNFDFAIGLGFRI